MQQIVASERAVRINPCAIVCTVLKQVIDIIGFLTSVAFLPQILRAGDAVVAAARRPEQSAGLTKLKQQYGATLQLVKLDVNDDASLKVFAPPQSSLYRSLGGHERLVGSW